MTVYLAATFDLLRRHSLNTLVIDAIEASLPLLDLARDWGVKIVVRVDRDLPKAIMEHEAVLAYMMGDEPKLDDLERYLAKYEAIRENYPEKPIVTCMVGESVGTWSHNDPIPIWEQLKPRLRMARLYPFRKENYDLLSHTTYKPKLPPHAFFRWMSLYQEKFEGQWWYVAQTFGTDPTEERPDPYWRTPTGAEIRAMTHMALANGASGVLGWCLQSHAGYTALVGQRTLAAENECLAAFGRVADSALRNRDVLTSLTPKRFEVRCEPWELLPIGKQGGDSRPVVYVINRDTKHGVEGRIWIPKEKSKATITVGVFTGERLTVTRAGETASVVARFAPGQGRLLAFRP